jgi:hypothetical protein
MSSRLRRRSLLDEIMAETLRTSAREVYPTLGELLAERYPTVTELERERYRPPPQRGNLVEGLRQEQRR